MKFRLLTAGVFALTLVLPVKGFSQEGEHEPKPLPVLEKKASDPATGLKLPVLATFSDLPGWISSVTFTADGKTLLAGTEDRLLIFDLGEKKLAKTLKIRVGFLRAMAVHPTEPWIAIGGYQSLQLWNTATWERVREIKGHRGYVTGIAWSPDGTKLATSCEDELARIFTVADPTASPQLLKGHEFPVNGIAWSPNGKQIATAAGDETRVTKPGEVKVWNAESSEQMLEFRLHKKSANSVAFSPDSKSLASTSQDERVNIYHLETGQPHGYFGGHSRPTQGVIFHPNGETVISGSGGRAVGKNEIKLWQVQDGEERGTLEGQEGKIAAIALSKDAKLLASGSHDKSVVVFDASPLLKKNATGVLGAITGLLEALPHDSPADALKPANR